MSTRPDLKGVLDLAPYVTRPGDWLVLEDGRCIVLAPGSVVQMADGTTALNHDGEHVPRLGDTAYPTLHRTPESMQ